MERLCERPGCSERASVAYGMRPEDLVFWLDRLPDVPAANGGGLCRRHADAMVVPRGWTLDDLRDPDLHLFRPPTPLPAPPRRPRQSTPRRDRSDASNPEQLELGAEPPETLDPGPWSPDFDEADDLDGLLSAHSPLLARAFRTADRMDR